MKKYKIEITETLQRVEEVEAENEAGAFDKVREQYKQQKIVLDWGDFKDVEFNNYNLLPTIFTITKEEILSHLEELKEVGKVNGNKKLTRIEIKEVLDSVEGDELLARDIRNSIRNSILDSIR